jgi:hypothetical protein
LLGVLPMGRAIVKLQDRHSRPFAIQVPRLSIRKGSVTDKMLRTDSTDSSPEDDIVALVRRNRAIPLRCPPTRGPRRRKFKIYSPVSVLVFELAFRCQLLQGCPIGREKSSPEWKPASYVSAKRHSRAGMEDWIFLRACS